VASFTAYSAAPGAPRSTVTDKVVKNLATFLCQDKDFAPLFMDWREVTAGIHAIRKDSLLTPQDAHGRKSKVVAEEAVLPDVLKDRLIRRGAQAALSAIGAEFEDKLFDVLPVVWEIMAQPLILAYCKHVLYTMLFTYSRCFSTASGATPEQEQKYAQAIIDCLTLSRCLAPALHPSLHSQIVTLFPTILCALKSRFSIIRHCAAQCLAAFCDVVTPKMMRLVVEEVIPLLGDPLVVTNRQGALEVIHGMCIELFAQ
jgi:TATA-binding protein-associated factor